MIDRNHYSDETNIAVINELKELGLELKAQEARSDNTYYQAGLEVAKQLVVKRLKAISVSLLHEAAERVNNKD